jgi:hypothetical protein
MVSRRLAYDAARRMRKRPQAGASLRETVLRNMPANVAPLFRAADYGLVTSSVARTAFQCHLVPLAAGSRIAAVGARALKRFRSIYTACCGAACW